MRISAHNSFNSVVTLEAVMAMEGMEDQAATSLEGMEDLEDLEDLEELEDLEVTLMEGMEDLVAISLEDLGAQEASEGMEAMIAVMDLEVMVVAVAHLAHHPLVHGPARTTGTAGAISAPTTASTNRAECSMRRLRRVASTSTLESQVEWYGVRKSAIISLVGVVTASTCSNGQRITKRRQSLTTR